MVNESPPASSPRAGFRPAGFGRLGAFFTNTTPELAPMLAAMKGAA